MTDSKSSGNSSLYSKLRVIKPAWIELENRCARSGEPLTL